MNMHEKDSARQDHGISDTSALMGDKGTHGGRKFATGLAFGAMVGSAVAIFAARKMERMVDEGKTADAEAVLNRTGARAHRMGDTARYTVRSMGNSMAKGIRSIQKDVGKSVDDIQKTMHPGE